MAEVIGLVASLITVAGVGAKLSNKLLKITDRNISAEHQLKRVAMNISMFAGTLKYFAKTLEENANLISTEGKEIATLLMEQCDGVFADFTNLAVSAGSSSQSAANSVPGTAKRSRRDSAVHRIKAFFEQPKVTTLLSELEYLKSTLGLLTQTLILAATTANGRKESLRSVACTMPAATAARIEDERIHVETLIMTRQLALNIMIVNSAEEVKEPSNAPHISPAASEDSFDEVKHTPRLMLPEPSQISMSMVRLGDPTMEYLHRAFPGEITVREPNREDPPMMAASHSHIIDQLLGRWTRLNEIELDMQTDRGDAVNGKAPQETPVKASQGTTTPELTLSRVESPEDFTAQRSMDYVSQKQVAISSPTGSSLPIPPPPKNTANLTVNSRLVPNHPSMVRSMSTPGRPVMSLSQTARSLSPQPTIANAVAIPDPYMQLGRTPRRSSRSQLSPNVSPANSYSSADPIRRRNWRPPHVEESASEAGSESGETQSDEEARMGLGIKWTIRSGNDYWDLLDGKVYGPRSPLLPTETLEELYGARQGKTEISTEWISEDALRERGLPCKMVTIKGLQAFDDEKRWVIDRVMRFNEVGALVDRTVKLIEARRRSKQTRTSSMRRPSNEHRRPPPSIQTYGNVAGNSTYQSPTSQTPREAVQAFHTMPQTARPAHQGQYPRQPSYPEPPRPGSSGLGGSRLSADFGHPAERNVHFSSSTRGGSTQSNSPQTRDFANHHYDQNNFHYNRKGNERRERHRDRDRDVHDSSTDGSEYERRQRRRSRRNRTTAVVTSALGLTGLLEVLDDFIA